MKLGKIFCAVLLLGLQEQQNLLHGGEDEAGENILCCAPVGSPGATEPTPWLLQAKASPGTFPFARKITRTSSLETKVSPPVCRILQTSGTVALRSQGRRGIGPGIEERCWKSWCLVESAFPVEADMFMLTVFCNLQTYTYIMYIS